MNNYFNFAIKAIGKTIYVDVDGTILCNFNIPSDVQGSKLEWWTNNLDVTKKITSRLMFLAVLKFFGSKLVIWTNRSEQHKNVTVKSLGIFVHLFSDMQFFGGAKSKNFNSNMFLMDDDKSFKGTNVLTVKRM